MNHEMLQNFYPHLLGLHGILRWVVLWLVGFKGEGESNERFPILRDYENGHGKDEPREPATQAFRFNARGEMSPSKHSH